MSAITLDGSQFSDVDSHLLAALTLSAATGQPFEMREVGKHASPSGVTPLHLTALHAMAALCDATVKGDAVRAKQLAFAPTRPPVARDLVVDTGEATGRPSPAPIMPLVEALLPVLARTGRDAFVRLRGTNASPFCPSAFWQRETLAPMLRWLGIEAAIEVERWGWHPEGGGETTLMVEAQEGAEPRGLLDWQERGDPVALWALVALSPRLEERVGQQMVETLRRALAADPFGSQEIEIARVRSPGPGSGIFVSMQFEHVTAGFEAVSHRGMAAQQMAEDVAASLTHFFWSDAALEPELARALLLPLALSGREATFTTSELTLPMRILADVIPRFLPVRVTLSKHPTGGQIEVRRAGA